jgi:hypothetical protein
MRRVLVDSLCRPKLLFKGLASTCSLLVLYAWILIRPSCEVQCHLAISFDSGVTAHLQPISTGVANVGFDEPSEEATILQSALLVRGEST